MFFGAPVRQSLFVLIAFVAFPTLSHAATYYVAPDGDNGDAGTIGAPFATLSHAYSLVAPGDTIYMRDGVYSITTQILLTESGTSDDPITIANYPDETPIIDASGMTDTDADGYAVYLYDASWHVVRGLTIRQAPESGFVVAGNSSNNTFERLTSYENGRLSNWEGKGIVYIGTGSNNLFLNNDSYDNQDIPGDNADGFQFISTGSGNVARGNRAWGNADDGYDLFNVLDDTENGYWTLENNWAWENGFDSLGDPSGDGFGFKLGGRRDATTSLSGGHTVRNNMSWSNRRGGFNENNANVAMEIYNNTAYDNPNQGFWSYTTDHTFKNNLAFYNGDNASTTDGADETINSWTLPVTLASSTFVSLDDTTARGARQSDGSLPETTFLALANDSVVIDIGVDVGIDFNGSGPDLGARESAVEVGGVAEIVVDDNLIENPSFESGLSDWLDWDNIATTSNPSRSGDSGLVIGLAAGGLGQDVTDVVAIASTYTLSGWLRKGTAGESLYLGVVFDDAEDEEISLIEIEATSTAYQYYEFEFTVPADTASAEIYVWKDGTTRYAYADDLALLLNVEEDEDDTPTSGGGGGGCLNCAGGGSSGSRSNSSNTSGNDSALNTDDKDESSDAEAEDKTSSAPDGASGSLDSPRGLIELFHALGIISDEDLLRAFAALDTLPSSDPALVTEPFTRTLRVNDTGPDVQRLQIFLNARGFTVAPSGAGAPGFETTYFGPRTREAVARFQEAYRADILTPLQLTQGTGFFGTQSMLHANMLLGF